MVALHLVGPSIPMIFLPNSHINLFQDFTVLNKMTPLGQNIVSDLNT